MYEQNSQLIYFEKGMYYWTKKDSLMNMCVTFDIRIPLQYCSDWDFTGCSINV